MPENIGHMLICNKAVKVLQGEGEEYQQFIDILDSERYKPYLNLGAVGPDLSYFGSQIKGLYNLISKKTDKPLRVDGWSYFLHSKEPNQFPLTLTDLTWRDTNWKEQDWKVEDLPKFAFTSGYLSRVAADQIIHPMVNEFAGPYYRKGKYRDPNDDYLSNHLSEFAKRYGGKWVVIAGGEAIGSANREDLSRLVKKARERFPKETPLASPIPREEELECIL